jgi:nucleotide-binding universal stress UspA family protein
MDMAPIPEDAEMSATTAAAMSPKLPHERYQPCRHGRNIIVAVDHGQESRRAFEWAITNLMHMADTLYLLHVLPTNYMQGRTDEASAVMQATEVLFDKLAKQAYEVAMVKTERRIMEGDPGKVICQESARLDPAAIVMGCRGRGVVKSVLLGSVSEYCTRHSLCPVVIVPHKVMLESHGA